MVKAKSQPPLIICDAGPIIHLDEIGSLSLLSNNSDILIPEIVWEEVNQHRPQAIEICEKIAKKISPKKTISPKLQAIIQLYSLHAGEIQALQLAAEYPPDLFLTDDTAARLAAGSLSIPVHGTLGILLRAIRLEQLTPKEVIIQLKSIPKKSTLHLKSSLLQQIIKQVEVL